MNNLDFLYHTCINLHKYNIDIVFLHVCMILAYFQTYYNQKLCLHRV